jgi:hypothetical protein
MHGGKILDQIEITLRGDSDHYLTVLIDVYNNSLSRRWLAALNNLIKHNYHLEKNYCFFGFVKHRRDGTYILEQVNRSIDAINQAKIGYHIDDYFGMENCVQSGPVGNGLPGRKLVQQKMNNLHRYFEDLQGVSGRMSSFAAKASPEIKWHIRQLNLLCHEFESWALSYRKALQAPAWQRPSQLMCWLNAPRFELEPDDYELFGIETLNRPLGGVFVGVNKAVGKHHWEVFHDEGRNTRLSELTTTTLRGQTEAAGDFDIEWANNPGEYEFQKKALTEFQNWLIDNGFDPNNKALTIGHPQVGQVRLLDSFGTDNYNEIWHMLSNHLDVFEVKTSNCSRQYHYRWDDLDYRQRQISIITGETHEVAQENR